MIFEALGNFALVYGLALIFMSFLERLEFYANILQITLVSEGNHYKQRYLITTLKSLTCVGGN